MPEPEIQTVRDPDHGTELNNPEIPILKITFGIVIPKGHESPVVVTKQVLLVYFLFS